MTLPGSSETMSGGGTGATHTINGKEYPVEMLAGADGHIIGSRPDFLINFTPAANAANRILGDLYNTGAVPIRVRGIWIIPTMTTIAGAAIDWIIGRTTAVGTGGVAVTPVPMDTAGGAWPAAATARSNPTAGATAGVVFTSCYTMNEETMSYLGLLQFQNQLPQLGDRTHEIVIRQNEGMAIRQSAVANAVGLTGALLLATFDN